MVEGLLDIIDFATRTNAELAQLGVPDERITFERLRRTGHPRRVSPAYARSIGCFGGVRSTKEISALAGVESVVVDLDSKRVEVTGSELDDAAIRAAIEEAGYEAA